MYFDADSLYPTSNNRRVFRKKSSNREYLVDHLNQSLFVSSPVGRLNSYIKAFLHKYVELKN